MKIVILLAIVAFASAGPVQKGPIVISTPEKVVVVSESQKDFLGGNNYLHSNSGYYGHQYWPQGKLFQVAQYIAHQFQQAEQNGLTTAQFNSYLIKQGFPQSIAQYFTEQYDFYKNQPFGKLPYQTFQYYYEQEIPLEVQQYVAYQIGQAYQQYQQYFLKNGQQSFEQNYPGIFPQYVSQQAKYYSKNGLTYPAVQYAYQQLQQAEQYAQIVLQYLENSKIPHEVYQYLFEQLQQGHEYVQNFQKVYLSYESYQQYYVPDFAAQYAFQQVQEAYQHFQNAYQYIQQQQLQGNWPQISYQYIFEHLNLAYQAAQYAYQTYQQSHYGQNYLGYSNQLSFDSPQYVAQQLQQVQQYAQKSLQYIQQLQFAQVNVPESVVTYIVQQFQQGLSYANNAYQATQQVNQYQSSKYVTEQTQHALYYFQNAYQTIQQYSWSPALIQWVEYILQYAQNSYYAAQNASYHGLYSSYGFNVISEKPKQIYQYWPFSQQYAKQFYQPNQYNQQYYEHNYPSNKQSFVELNYQNEPISSGYYGSYSSPISQYGPYQYGYQGLYNGNQLYTSYPYGVFNKAVLPYQNSGHYAYYAAQNASYHGLYSSYGYDLISEKPKQIYQYWPFSQQYAKQFYQPSQYNQQYYEQNYPSNKQSFVELNYQNEPISSGYYGSYSSPISQYGPYPYGYQGLYNGNQLYTSYPYGVFNNGVSPISSGYYGSYSSPISQYGPYQYGYQGLYNGNQLHTSYPYGALNKGVSPYQNSGHYAQVAAAAA